MCDYYTCSKVPQTFKKKVKTKLLYVLLNYALVHSVGTRAYSWNECVIQYTISVDVRYKTLAKDLQRNNIRQNLRYHQHSTRVNI